MRTNADKLRLKIDEARRTANVEYSRPKYNVATLIHPNDQMAFDCLPLHSVWVRLHVTLGQPLNPPIRFTTETTSRNFGHWCRYLWGARRWLHELWRLSSNESCRIACLPQLANQIANSVSRRLPQPNKLQRLKRHARGEREAPSTIHVFFIVKGTPKLYRCGSNCTLCAYDFGNWLYISIVEFRDLLIQRSLRRPIMQWLVDETTYLSLTLLSLANIYHKVFFADSNSFVYDTGGHILHPLLYHGRSTWRRGLFKESSRCEKNAQDYGVSRRNVEKYRHIMARSPVSTRDYVRTGPKSYQNPRRWVPGDSKQLHRGAKTLPNVRHCRSYACRQYWSISTILHGISPLEGPWNQPRSNSKG